MSTCIYSVHWSAPCSIICKNWDQLNDKRKLVHIPDWSVCRNSRRRQGTGSKQRNAVCFHKRHVKSLYKFSEMPDTLVYHLYILLCHMSDSGEIKSPLWMYTMIWIQKLYREGGSIRRFLFIVNKHTRRQDIYIHVYSKFTKFWLKRDNWICTL